MAKIKKIYKGGVEYEISGNEIDSVTVDYQEDGGSPDASAQYSDGELAFSLKNMKMKFSELTAAEKAEITGPQGPQGDSAIWTGEGEPWSGLKNTSGQSTTEPMTQKAVTDAINAISADVHEHGFYIVDMYGYIGFYVDATGSHSANLVEFKN